MSINAQTNTMEKILMKAMTHLFQSMPFDEKVQLPGGLEGVAKPFLEPRFNNNGTLRAGIDVKIFKDGEHLGHYEFILTLNNWEGDRLAPSAWALRHGQFPRESVL